MHPLILSAIMTSLVYLVHYFSNQKQKLSFYLILFLAFSILDFVLDYTWKANASELRSHFNRQYEYDMAIRAHKFKNSRKEIFKNYYRKFESMKEYHSQEADRYYNEAESICDRFANIEDREKSRYILRSAFVLALPATPAYRIFFSIMSALEIYFSDRWEDLQRLESKLIQAKSHAEMYEHYRHLQNYCSEEINLERKKDGRNQSSAYVGGELIIIP